MKKFLLDELGIEKGNAIYRLQQERLDILICNIQNKSKSQTKTLINMILPRVALYQVLKKDKQLCPTLNQINVSHLKGSTVRTTAERNGM